MLKNLQTFSLLAVKSIRPQLAMMVPGGRLSQLSQLPQFEHRNSILTQITIDPIFEQSAILQMSKKRKNAIRKRRKRTGDKEIICRNR